MASITYFRNAKEKEEEKKKDIEKIKNRLNHSSNNISMISNDKRLGFKWPRYDD